MSAPDLFGWSEVRLQVFDWPDAHARRTAKSLSIDDLAPVRMYHLARDIGRILGGQENIGRSHLAWLSGAPHRSMLSKSLYALECGRDQRSQMGPCHDVSLLLALFPG